MIQPLFINSSKNNIAKIYIAMKNMANLVILLSVISFQLLLVQQTISHSKTFNNMYRFGVGNDHTTEMGLPDIATRIDSSVIAQFETSHSQIIDAFLPYKKMVFLKL